MVAAGFFPTSVDIIILPPNIYRYHVYIIMYFSIDPLLQSMVHLPSSSGIFFQKETFIVFSEHESGATTPPFSFPLQEPLLRLPDFTPPKYDTAQEKETVPSAYNFHHDGRRV